MCIDFTWCVLLYKRTTKHLSRLARIGKVWSLIDRRVTYTVYAKVWRGIDSGHFARESNVIYRELVFLCLLVFVYILYIFWQENIQFRKYFPKNGKHRRREGSWHKLYEHGWSKHRWLQGYWATRRRYQNMIFVCTF